MVMSAPVTAASPAPIPPDDVKWSTVPLSEVLDRGSRFEASVYDIEGKHARETLARCQWPVTTISGKDGLAVAYHRQRFRRIFLETSDYPIYQPSQITEILPKPYLWISSLTNTDIDALRVKQGQLLVTCSGTIGKCTLVGKTLDGFIFSHDLLRIAAKTETDTGYLFAFLKTKIGQTLFRTNNYGAVISHVEPEHLDNIPIPNPSPIIKTAIHDMIAESFRLRDESNDQLTEAEKLLVAELGLPPINRLKSGQFDYAAGFDNFTVKLSGLTTRFEATYHKPLVHAIQDHIAMRSEVTTVADTRISKSIGLAGRFKRVYVGEGQGIAFFGGKELLSLDPRGDKYLSLKHHGARIADELTIKENMVMVTCSGTIGKVALAPRHWEGWTANQHVLRIVPSNDDIAGYLYVWLASDYGHELIRRFTYGAVVEEIDDNHIGQVCVPLLKDQGAQKRINELALNANGKRHEAFQLEQAAIDMVNKKVIFAAGAKSTA